MYMYMSVYLHIYIHRITLYRYPDLQKETDKLHKLELKRGSGWIGDHQFRNYC